ncbi:MAG: hypothetical protein ABFD77_02080, partial [Thermotogota bacterium]
NSPELLKDYETNGVAAGKSLASLGETAAGTMTKIVELGTSIVSFVSKISADDIRKGIQDFVDAFNTLSTILHYIKTTFIGIYYAIKLVISVIADFITSIGKAFDATENVKWIFGVKGSTGGGFLNKENWSRTASAIGGMQEFGQGEVRYRQEQNLSDAERKFPNLYADALKNLKSRQAEIEGTIGAKADELSVRNGHVEGGGSAFSGMNAEKQLAVLNELRAVRGAIEKIAQMRPEIKMSEQKVGEAVLKSPAMSGEDSLDDTAFAPAY